MDRRALLAGLFSVAGAAAVAVVLPTDNKALAGVPTGDPTPGSSILPNLDNMNADPDEASGAPAGDEGLEQLAWHRGHRHWRRRRRRGWRRVCRRYWRHGRVYRRCRRRPVWIWLGLG